MGRRVVHGTYTAYSKGCRCTRCRKAWATYMREYKDRVAGGYFTGREVSVRVRLTPLAARIIETVVSRNVNATTDDVIEEALRRCGADVQFAA